MTPPPVPRATGVLPPDSETRSCVRRCADRIKLQASRHWSDPLSRGGLALLLNTGLTGVLGFGYWIVAARLFSTFAVGVAGALVAATTLFSGLGQLNLSGMLMRFLPTAGASSRRLVLAAYGFAAGTSALLAAVALVGIRRFAAPSSPLRLDVTQSAMMVLAAAVMAIFILQDNVLVGLRRAVWVPAENGAFGVAKIIALAVVAPLGTAFALFAAWMTPLVLTIPVISSALFFRFLPPAARPPTAGQLGPQKRAILYRFAAGDAAGGIFTQTWTYLLPILITASLGARNNALFFTSFLFSSTIDQVAANYASPLTVEGAHAPDRIPALIRQALRHIFIIVLPIVIVMCTVCPWLLRAFGDKYAPAAPLLALLLIACLPKAICTVYYSYCRIQRSTHRSAIIQACVCVLTLSAAAAGTHRFGLIAVGAVVLGVQTCAAVACAWALRREVGQAHRRRPDGAHYTELPGHGR